jgi:hypothetical protein
MLVCPLSSIFHPASAGVGVMICSVMMSSGFTLGDVGGLSKVCYKCVSDVQKRLKIPLTAAISFV